MSAGVAAILSGIGFLTLLGGFGLLVRKKRRAYPVLLLAAASEIASGILSHGWFALTINLAMVVVVIGLWRQRVRADRGQQLTVAARSTREPQDAAIGCVFCDIIDGLAAAQTVREWDDAIAIVPRDPVVDGHLIVLPKTHVPDAGDPGYAALTIHRAAALAAELYPSFNLITSVGRVATQTVFHLHMHVVPRRPGDGLELPWAGGSRG